MARKMVQPPLFFFNLFDTYSYWKILVKIFSIRKYYNLIYFSIQFSRSVVYDSVTPWTAVCQASLSITNSRILLKLMSTELVMPSNYLILCHPLFLLPSLFPSIRVFSNDSALHISWPQYWSFNSASVLPMNIQGWFPLGLTGLISLLSKGLSRIFSSIPEQRWIPVFPKQGNFSRIKKPRSPRV